MNALLQPVNALVDAEVPTLANSPLRPDPKAIILDGPLVIVTREFYDANEAQLRHITSACITAERTSAAREEARAYLRAECDRVLDENAALQAEVDAHVVEGNSRRHAFAAALALYQPAVLSYGLAAIDWDGSMTDSFAKLVDHWKSAMRVLGELCELKHIKDTLGKTPEYLERQPKAWEAAVAILGNFTDTTATTLVALRQQLTDSEVTRLALKSENERLNGELNMPETKDFASGLFREAAHQRDRWGTASETLKTPEDWSWLVGYLVGKALRGFATATALGEAAEKMPSEGGHRIYMFEQARKAHGKGVHHLVTSAAALANWHLNATGVDKRMAAGKAFGFQVEEEPEEAQL